MTPVSLTLALASLVLAAFAAQAEAISPMEAAAQCYDEMKKMRLGSRETEDRYWEDCMVKYRTPVAPTPSPSATPRAIGGADPGAEDAVVPALPSEPAAPEPAAALESRIGVWSGSAAGAMQPDGRVLHGG